ncbi:sulfotransferase [Candidatus Pelagibacter sp.]|nr:sulfotransferase [Candidatus Pelagibacter sp.]
MDLEVKIKSIHSYIQNRKFLKAKDLLNKILKKFPNNPYLLNLNGMTHQFLDDHISAINFFNLAIKNEGKNIAAMNNLANSHKKLLNYFEADLIYKKILKIDPDYIHGLNNYANLKLEINNYNDAISLFKKALLIASQKDVQPLNMMLSLAGIYQSVNDLENLRKILNEIFIIDPKCAAAHKILSEITKYSADNSSSMDHIGQMKEIQKDQNLDTDDKIILSFSIGKSFEDLKKYEESFNYLQLANDLKNKKNNSNLNDEIKIFKNIEKTFKNISFENLNQKSISKKIIFVCGMPRSGTTLVEQILSAHPEVFGAGELLYLEKIVKNNFIIDNKINNQKIIDRLNDKQDLIFSDYLNFFKIYNFKENIIIDKTPQNFKWIGFIKLFFPNAKIINCNRNPKDICVSLFKNDFASSMMNWAFNQEEISDYYNHYHQLINFWKDKISNSIYDLNYERLVNDSKNEIDKLLNFCDLDLNEKCYNFTKFSKTPVKTVSVSQANKPIYKDSINSHNSYEIFLKNMFNKLNII